MNVIRSKTQWFGNYHYFTKCGNTTLNKKHAQKFKDEKEADKFIKKIESFDYSFDRSCFILVEA